MYKIETGIPLPNRYGAEVRILENMNNGESFLIPDNDNPRSKAASYRKFASENKMAIMTKVVDGGIRVWLVEKDASGKCETTEFPLPDRKTHVKEYLKKLLVGECFVIPKMEGNGSMIRCASIRIAAEKAGYALAYNKLDDGSIRMTVQKRPGR